MFSNNKENRIVALFLVLFCIFIYFYIIPHYVSVVYQGKTEVFVYLPTIFPRFITIFIAILAFLLLNVQKEAKEEKKEPILEKEENTRVLLKTMVIVFAYIYSIDLIGYWSATPIFLGTMVIFLGIRNRRTIIFTTLLFPVGVYIFFQKFLKIFLPLGSFFEYFE